MTRFTEFLKGIGAALETVAFFNPWIIVGVIIAWRSPKIIKHFLKYLTERERIRGKLEGQRERFALEMDKKQRKIESRKRKETQ